MLVEDRVAIVTGASSGIGRQTSIQLADKGYHLLLVGRHRQKLEETRRLARNRSSSGQAEIALTDLCDAASARQLVDSASKRFGRIDAIANVAGYAPMLPIEQVSAEQWRAVIDTNLSCVVNLTAAAWPILCKRNGGVIVNVSSMASVDPFPGLSAYATAKAALNMWTRSTAREGQDVGIRAVAVAPGAVETPMLRALFDEATIPKHKTLAPADVARVIVDCVAGTHPFEPGETIFLPSP